MEILHSSIPRELGTPRHKRSMDSLPSPLDQSRTTPQSSEIRSFFEDEPGGRNDTTRNFCHENNDIARLGHYPAVKIAGEPTEMLAPDLGLLARVIHRLSWSYAHER